MATSRGLFLPLGELEFALWSSRMFMNFPRFGKSLRITSSNGTLLASHPVARPPEPFLYLFSPPPPRKRRWSLFQSLSATALLITFCIKFLGMLNWILDVPSAWEKRDNALLASGLPRLHTCNYAHGYRKCADDKIWLINRANNEPISQSISPSETHSIHRWVRQLAGTSFIEAEPCREAGRHSYRQTASQSVSQSVSHWVIYSVNQFLHSGISAVMQSFIL